MTIMKQQQTEGSFCLEFTVSGKMLKKGNFLILEQTLTLGVCLYLKLTTRFFRMMSLDFFHLKKTIKNVMTRLVTSGLIGSREW